MLRRFRPLLLLLAAACGTAESVHDPSRFPEAGKRRSRAIALREVATSPSDAAFTAIDALDVDSHGVIYVPDMYQTRITVLDPSAKMMRTFGRRGSGPGEFRSIRGVQVIAGDSLLAYDPTLGRLTVFAPGSDQAAYSVSLAGKLSGPMPFEVRRTADNSALFTLFRPQFQFVAGADFSTRKDRVRLLALDGMPQRDLLEFPSRSFLVAENSVMPHPFGHEGFALLDSGNHLHFIWSDSLGVARYDLEGRRTGGFSLPYTAPQLTPDDHRDALAAIPEQVRARFAPTLRDSLPSRWPAVRSAMLDDRDRIWVALGASARQPTEWAAFSVDGAYLGSMLVPAGSEVRRIRADGRVYASRNDEDDVPHVVIYQLGRPLR